MLVRISFWQEYGSLMEPHRSQLISIWAMVSGQTLSSSQASVKSSLWPQVRTDVSTWKGHYKSICQDQRTIQALTSSLWVSYIVIHQEHNLWCPGKTRETLEMAGWKGLTKKEIAQEGIWIAQQSCCLEFWILSYIPRTPPPRQNGGIWPMTNKRTACNCW